MLPMPKILSYGRRQLHSTARVLTNEVTKFSSRMTGTSSGPFSELPEFRPLQGSMMLKIPASCSIFTRLDKISALNVESKVSSEPFLSFDSETDATFSKVSTGDHPVNAMMVSTTPMSNITVIQIDDYTNGWYLTDPSNDVLCYSGDLSFQSGHKIRGRGILAVNGRGPVYQIRLDPDETVTINPDAILGYNQEISLQLVNLKSNAVIPDTLKTLSSKLFPLKYFGDYYDKTLLLWGKLFSRDQIYCEIKGPGTVLLQTAFIPGSKICSDTDLLNALKQ